MLIIPAIDLLDGECVRLFKGDYGQSKTYDKDPAHMAEQFQKMGVKRLHVVDLDAARGQGKDNRETIKRIRQVFKGHLEVGGGIRASHDIEALLSTGVDELIIGTVFARDPEKVAQWVRAFGAFFIAGIDALEGEVKVSGWEEGSLMTDISLALKAAETGINRIIYTNISRDGTLAGPDFDRTLAVAEASGLPVILSGGISCEADIVKTSGLCGRGIEGLITGKAFYEGHINLEKMLTFYS